MDERLIGGRYRLRGSLASGGTASIWRAIDEQTGEDVAIKLLHPHLAASDAARARLDREAAALGAIVHPNVVRVRDLVVDEGGPAVVMDFVEGGSLAERLREGTPLAEADALAIALEVTEALRAVHAAGMVHRDVKPGNILLGDDGRTRLIDFGIATDIEAGADVTALTATDDVIGTLRYLAPERLAGAVATPSTDLWGVGVVLYEMLAGAPAYPSATIVDRASSTTALPLRPADIGDGAWAIIGSAMALDPAARPVDATALAAALRKLLGDRVAAAPSVEDPWADTMTFAPPAAPPRPTTASVAATPAVAPTPGVSVRPAADVTGGRRNHRPAMAAGLGALGLAVLLIAAASLAGPSPDDAAMVAPTRSPSAAPSAARSPEPTATLEPAEDAEDDADEADNDAANGKGNGKGDGKGKGNGRGKDD